MPHHPPTLGRSAGRPPRRAVRRTALRAVVPVAVAGLGLSVYAGASGRHAPRPLPVAVQQAVDRHHCSTTGFSDRSPASALVRTPAGALRLVPFDDGWRILTRDDPQRLVAVCLDHPG